MFNNIHAWLLQNRGLPETLEEAAHVCRVNTDEQCFIAKKGVFGTKPEDVRFENEDVP